MLDPNGQTCKPTTNRESGNPSPGSLHEPNCTLWPVQFYTPLECQDFEGRGLETGSCTLYRMHAAHYVRTRDHRAPSPSDATKKT